MNRLPPLIAVTTPTGSAFALRAPGPARCAARRRRARRRGRRAASATRAGSSPNAAIASRIDSAVRVAAVEQPADRTCRRRRGCRAASSRSARLPRRRSPTTSTANGSRVPRAFSACDAFDRGDDAQHAVVLAGVAHGVEMRAQHQARRAGRLRLVAADAIADRIEPRRHAGVAHPAQHERVDRALLGATGIRASGRPAARECAASAWQRS